MTTYHFDGPRVQATKNLPCPWCGRKVRRQRTFQHTVNPFNRRDDGTPKTWDEVRQDVLAEVEAWKAVPEPHTACAEADEEF